MRFWSGGEQMASKVKALRALRSLGGDEPDTSDDNEEVTDAARAKARALYGPPPGEVDSDAEGEEGDGDEEEEEEEEGEEEDEDWERFFDVSTTSGGQARYTCKLLGKAFTTADGAREYAGGKLHSKAVAEARYKLLTYNEKQALEAKAAERKARRKQKALEKARLKVVAKRKATECAPALARQRASLCARRSAHRRVPARAPHPAARRRSLSDEQIAVRKARFALKKQRRLERKAAG